MRADRVSSVSVCGPILFACFSMGMAYAIKLTEVDDNKNLKELGEKIKKGV